MWRRLGRGWSMARASFSVLKRYPRLTILPVISTGVSLLVVGLLFLSLLPQLPRLHALTGGVWQWLGEDSGRVWYFLALFVVVYALTAVAVFCNVALIHCALRALAGEEASIRGGLATASGRLPQILGWALVVSTIGIALKVLHNFLENLGFIGELLGGVLEFGWSASTYFVVPVLAAEGVGPIAGIRRSAALVRGKWGESLAGEGRFGLVTVLFLLQAALVLVVGLSLTNEYGAGALIGPLVMALGVLYALGAMMVLQALNVIFQAGVYVYARTGRVPPALDAELVAGAFRRKDA